MAEHLKISSSSNLMQSPKVSHCYSLSVCSFELGAVWVSVALQLWPHSPNNWVTVAPGLDDLNMNNRSTFVLDLDCRWQFPSAAANHFQLFWCMQSTYMLVMKGEGSNMEQPTEYRHIMRFDG